MDIFICQFCGKETTNIGANAKHEKHCKNNPNYVKAYRSPNAGWQKGKESPLKGKSFPEKKIQTSIEYFENMLYKECVETVSRRHARRLLIHIKGNVCSICDTTMWQGKPVPLVCDHISGDSTDNSLDNFRLVCCNCDGQLPTYKSKNKGRGRKYDREYRKIRKANPIVGDGDSLENC